MGKTHLSRLEGGLGCVLASLLFSVGFAPLSCVALELQNLPFRCMASVMKGALDQQEGVCVMIPCPCFLCCIGAVVAPWGFLHFLRERSILASYNTIILHTCCAGRSSLAVPLGGGSETKAFPIRVGTGSVWGRSLAWLYACMKSVRGMFSEGTAMLASRYHLESLWLIRLCLFQGPEAREHLAQRRHAYPDHRLRNGKSFISR